MAAKPLHIRIWRSIQEFVARGAIIELMDEHVRLMHLEKERSNDRVAAAREEAKRALKAISSVECIRTYGHNFDHQVYRLQIELPMRLGRFIEEDDGAREFVAREMAYRAADEVRHARFVREPDRYRVPPLSAFEGDAVPLSRHGQ